MNILWKILPQKTKEKFKKKLTIYSAAKPYILEKEIVNPLQGKVAVVTGGSGAIGRAICFKLASKGAKVYVAGRTAENVEKVVNEIRGLGLLSQSLIVDVTDEAGVDSSFENVIDEKRIDILINCAGGGARGEMREISEQRIEVIDQVLNQNLRGTMICTRKAAQYMKRQKSGKIVIISSAVGIQGKALYSEYAAAKSGMFGFAKSVALELGKYGINVNCVTPGFIQRGEFDGNTEDWLRKTNCLRSIGTLEDISEAVYFMVSDNAKFITGQNLVVDGGRTLGLYGDR